MEPQHSRTHQRRPAALRSSRTPQTVMTRKTKLRDRFSQAPLVTRIRWLQLTLGRQEAVETHLRAKVATSSSAKYAVQHEQLNLTSNQKRPQGCKVLVVIHTSPATRSKRAVIGLHTTQQAPLKATSRAARMRSTSSHARRSLIGHQVRALDRSSSARHRT